MAIELPPLPYDLDALAPHISAETLELVNPPLSNAPQIEDIRVHFRYRAVELPAGG